MIRRPMRLDSLNLAILRLLREGRRAYKSIAAELQVSENTVRGRIRRLADEGVLEVMGLVNPDALEGHRAILVGVKLKSPDLVKKGEEFSRLKGVVSVSVVTGRFDLFLLVLLAPGFDLLEFFTREVSRIADVLATETFVVYKNFNLRIPYAL